MSWRVVVVSRCSKLDYKMDYMVVRQNDSINKIHLSEIYLLILESTAVSVTAVLLSELVKRKIKIVFCDEKRNPLAELAPYYGSHDTSSKIRGQIAWKSDIKTAVWTEIVREKIKNQAGFLLKLQKIKEYEMLTGYCGSIEPGDATNREGHAAKVYFNAIFGMEFARTSEIPINAALDYGYSILLSAFNREVTANGYITQLGLFHDNMFNQFNLSCDLIEPFRVLVDKAVYKMNPGKLEREEKNALIDLLNCQVIIDGRKNYLNNAIKIYCRSVFNALENGDPSAIRFIEDELQVHENNSIF